MNREIKFRGKSFDNNWVYGFYQEVEVEGKIFSYIFWQGHPTPVIKESVGQLFTSNTMPNFYEGDIITDTLNFSNEPDYKCAIVLSWDNLKDVWETAFCIGNIFDNPELVVKNSVLS